MKNFLAVIGGIVAGFFLLLFITYYSNVMNTPGLSGEFRRTYNPTPPVEVASGTPVPGEITNYYTRQKLNYVLSRLNVEFKGSDINWTYDNEEGYFYFDISSANIDRTLIDAAANGDRSAQTTWDLIKDRLISIQKGVQQFAFYEEDDTCIVFNIVNPKDKEDVFLTVADSFAGYDVVTGLSMEHH